MRYKRRLVLGLAILPALLLVVACSGSGKSDSGVAQIDESQPVDIQTKSKSGSDGGVDTADLTDEEITTRFTACFRDHGFNIPDPEINADGTVDLGALKQSIAQDPKNEARSKKAYDDCLPLLEGANFAKKGSPEDEIELQDNLLIFAKCLRDNGIDVPDPGSSDDSRGGMKSFLADLKGADSRVQKGIDECNELVFGAGKSGK